MTIVAVVLVWGPHPPVLSAYSRLCSGVTPGGSLGIMWDAKD